MPKQDILFSVRQTPDTATVPLKTFGVTSMEKIPEL